MVRRYLEKKAAEKENEKLDESDPLILRDQLTHKSSGHGKSSLDTSHHAKDKGVDHVSDIRRGFFAKLRNNTSDSRKDMTSGGPTGARRNSLDNTLSSQNGLSERPAFRSALHGQSSINSKLQPRGVAIPYSRFKKERFYDWPPDPTVSRATPIVLHPEIPIDHDDSLSASVPDIPLLEHEIDEFHFSLRKRHSTKVQCESDIPDSIVF